MVLLHGGRWTYLTVGREGHGDDRSDSEELEEGVHGESSLLFDAILEL